MFTQSYQLLEKTINHCYSPKNFIKLRIDYIVAIEKNKVFMKNENDEMEEKETVKVHTGNGIFDLLTTTKILESDIRETIEENKQ